MAWQDFPFPSVATRFLDSGILTVGNLPTIVVDSKFSWDTICASVLGAIIGAAIPAALSYYAITKSAKTLKEDREEHARHAKEQLRGELVSSSRQTWINELRDSAAKYISVANKLNNYQIMITKAFKENNQINDENYRQLRLDETGAKSELSYLRAKLEMLMNPNEKESVEIMKALERFTDITNNYTPGKDHDFDEIFEQVKIIKTNIQNISKSEWNKIKNLE